MATTNIQQNATPVNEPTLQDLLNLLKKDIFIHLNCHHIGSVQSFDSSKQTAMVSIAYKKTIFEPDPVTGAYSAKLIDYPVLIDCPVIVLGGGAASLTFPVAPGDECLVLFNDRDIDNWFKSGQTGPVATPRLHSFADGFALVGIRSMNSVLQGYNSVNAVFQNGTSGVSVAPDDVIKIYNATTTLNTLLQQILTQLEILANTPAVPGNPINPAVAAALVLLGTDLDGLLG